MTFIQRIKAAWRFLDECAVDHDPLADLAERVAGLERRCAERTDARAADTQRRKREHRERGGPETAGG